MVEGCAFVESSVDLLDSFAVCPTLLEQCSNIAAAKLERFHLVAFHELAQESLAPCALRRSSRVDVAPAWVQPMATQLREVDLLNRVGL